MDRLPLEELVAHVERSADGALARLDEATALREALAADADRVMDHFVDQARAAGESWTAIGDRLGVSRQAARQRFNDRVQPSFGHKLLPRLRACLDQAQREAQADGSTEVGTQHLLTGLLAEGVAAATLEKLGLTPGASREASHRLFGPPAPATTNAATPMSAEATCALEAAVHTARTNTVDRDTEPNVGTEHLLAALALDPGSRARRVLNDLDIDIAAIKRELKCYLTPPRRRRRQGGKFNNGSACSFCGRPATDAGHLVAGPGVRICSACVDIAVDVLERRRTGQVQ